VYATDGLIDSIKYNGMPLDTGHSYNVVIADFMYDNDTAGTCRTPWSRAPRNRLSTNHRLHVAVYKNQNQMTVSGPRYYSNNQLGGQFDAVVTMMDDSESAPAYQSVSCGCLKRRPKPWRTWAAPRPRPWSTPRVR